MRFIVDPVFYFYMFWIPKYLSQERGVTLEQIGQVTWIPFLALGISNIAGGWVSDWMIRRGLPAAARLDHGGSGRALSSSLAGRVQTLGMAITMMSLLMLAHGFWITNYVTVISERFPKGVGTVMGITGARWARWAACLANTAIGWCVDRFSWAGLDGLRPDVSTGFHGAAGGDWLQKLGRGRRRPNQRRGIIAQRPRKTR